MKTVLRGDSQYRACGSQGRLPGWAWLGSKRLRRVRGENINYPKHGLPLGFVHWACAGDFRTEKSPRSHLVEPPHFMLKVIIETERFGDLPKVTGLWERQNWGGVITLPPQKEEGSVSGLSRVSIFHSCGEVEWRRNTVGSSLCIFTHREADTRSRRAFNIELARKLHWRMWRDVKAKIGFLGLPCSHIPTPV